jgi:SAM-dependent methyltransferase
VIRTEVTYADAIEWDVVTWSSALRLWERKVQLRPGLRCLDIGARRGGLSLWLASKGCEVLCTDLTNPVADAQAYHGRFQVAGAIEYAPMNALEVPYSSYFDVVVFKSVLGGVGRDGHPERQARALLEMHKALKPGGALLFAENLVGSTLHQLLRRRFLPWGRSWRYVTIPEMRQHLSPFRTVELHAAGFWSAFGLNEASRRALGHVDRLVHGLVPVSSRYVLFGVAWK